MTIEKWVTGPEAWKKFVQEHPELGYRSGRMNFHNFLRMNRNILCAHDAIRLAKNKFWIAQEEKFCLVAFECATGIFRKNEVQNQIQPEGVVSVEQASTGGAA